MDRYLIPGSQKGKQSKLPVPSPVEQSVEQSIEWSGFTDGKVSALMTKNRPQSCTRPLLELLVKSTPFDGGLGDTPPKGKMTLPRSILQMAISRASVRHGVPHQDVGGFPKKVVLQDIDDYNVSTSRLPVEFLGTRYTDSEGILCIHSPLQEPGTTSKKNSPSLNSLSLLMGHFLSRYRQHSLQDDLSADFCEAARAVKPVSRATWEATKIQYELSNHSVLDRPLQFDKETTQVLVQQRKPLKSLNEEALVLLGFHLGELIEHAHRHGCAIGPIEPNMIHVDITGDVKVAHLAGCSRRRDDIDMDWFELASCLLRVYYNIPKEREADLVEELLRITTSSTKQQIQTVLNDVHRKYPGRDELSALTTTLLGCLIIPNTCCTFRQAMHSALGDNNNVSPLTPERLYRRIVGPARPAPSIPVKPANSPTQNPTSAVTAWKPTPTPRKTKPVSRAISEESPVCHVINEMVTAEECVLVTPPTCVSNTVANQITPVTRLGVGKSTAVVIPKTGSRAIVMPQQKSSKGILIKSRKMTIGDPSDVVHTRVA
ncbi:MAG: uncharacterized protein KVP18_001219 [Porospora cf. gigantea A]|uniref:uncharacterized protein n=1 Tax=Porospora cf. gigantea A TaxID=2853593 RepID=UPI003559F378|nr:MAG: hypothetical protein KVP18_001219 [Porospora cf. gigantea A]